MKSLTKRNVEIDWKKFGSIETNRFFDEITKNNSLVNEFGTYIAFCSIDGEFDTQLIDQNFIKLFKISQIIIEYLLNEFNRLKNCENEMKSQSNLIKENKKLRKLLEIHQKAMTYSGTVNGDYMQCSHCPKVFYDSTFLKRHFARRHPNESLDSEGMLPLTRKIEKYQSVLFGDNKSIEQMRTELQALTEKLGKTELDLLLEKEARIKCEERIERDVEVRVQQIQQNFREEMEDFKFTQRETFFQKQTHLSAENISNNDNDVENEQKNIKSTEVNKMEEMIAIQAKEMIKLGNNVQKLVTHLTESSSSFESSVGGIRPLNIREKRKPDAITNIQTHISDSNNKSQYYIKANKDDDKLEIKEEKTDENRNKNSLSDSKDKKKVNSKLMSDSRKRSVKNSVLNDLNEKLRERYGIDIESNGINEEEYQNALEEVKKYRNLSIQQYRHDYDYVSIEKSIRKIVDQKVYEITNRKSDDIESVEVKAKVRERKILPKIASITKTEESNTQTPKANEILFIEAVVHNSPVINTSVNSEQTIDSEIKEELIKPNSQIFGTQVVKPKSALASSSLKSGINEKSIDNENGVEVKQKKRITFSEHRIEHQISPDESSEDTSDELIQMDLNKVSLSAPYIPIPAQRNNINTSSNKSNSQLRDQIDYDYNEDENYESDEELMGQILDSKPYSMDSNLSFNESKSLDKLKPTKVQEIAELIEKQLSKRSASNKKPPIGSVNVMTADKQKLSSKSLMDRLNSDSEDEYI